MGAQSLNPERAWYVGGGRLGEHRHDQLGDTGAMKLPAMPPVAPMLAKAVTAIPPGASYEPKWDGFLH